MLENYVQNFLASFEMDIDWMDLAGVRVHSTWKIDQSFQLGKKIVIRPQPTRPTTLKADKYDIGRCDTITRENPKILWSI